MNVSIKTLATVLAACALTLGTVSCDKENDDKKPVNPDEKVDPNKPDPDKPDPAPVVAGDVINGEITGVKDLKAGTIYTLDGTLYVKKGGTLNIGEGAIISATPKFDSYIIVEPGGKINVNGTAEKPVIMTSTKKEPGAWGGLILAGNAQINEGSTHNVEINPLLNYGQYIDSKDLNNSESSGSIKYLILEYTGANLNDEVEHNGLTFYGVGSGTKVENVFVYKSADDGVEFFGGAVNVNNLLCVDNDDDMFDFTQGYIGTLSNAYGIWSASHSSTEKDPTGVEADGNHDGLMPNVPTQSNFKVENLTIALNHAPSDVKGEYATDVLKIRRGASATINGFYLIGGGSCENIIDTSDKKGDAVNVVINDNLNDYTGKTIGDTMNKGNFTENSMRTTGTDKALFAWTGYDFKTDTYTSKAK